LQKSGDPVQRHRARPLGVPLALAVWLALAAPAGAGQDDAGGEGDTGAKDRGRWIVGLQVENDRFTQTDRHYTNGIRASFLSPEDKVYPEAAGWLWDGLPIPEDRDHRRIEFALGQSMFTPEDTGRRDLIRDDRPYAGWLYGSMALLSYGEGANSDLESLELDLGVVGPASLAEQTQIFWHRQIGVQEPRGWDNQLDNEPGAILSYSRKWRRLLPDTLLGMQIDLTPHATVNLGNVLTSAGVGATARIGMDLPSDFGPPRIRPSLPGSALFEPDKAWAWYIFAGFEGRYVLHNIFLDGNTFSDSHSVDREPLVGDFQAGAAVTVGRMRLAYIYVLRTREFREQDVPDRFGVISLSFKF